MTTLSIPHVDESRLTALQSRLETLSRLSIDFVVLLAGSTVIATLGLFQNSPAVIIGAMIIAPLMRPLVGLSLASLTADTRLLIRATATLTVGTIVGVVISSTLAFFFRTLELTPEIMARTHPTLLDLGVALFAGAVGAYCQADEKLSDSVAGVAIAVALVPPLSVIGIGLAFGAQTVWTGASLLYATNLVGITVAGALVFLFKGYTPLMQAKQGLLISAAAMIVLMVPLALSMRELVLENLISGKIRNVLTQKTFTFKGVQLQELKVLRFRTPMSVTATVVASDQPITANQVRLVQDFLTHEIGVPITFRLRIIPATVLSARELPALETSNDLDNQIDVKQQVSPQPGEQLNPTVQKPLIEPQRSNSDLTIPTPTPSDVSDTPKEETTAPR